MTYIEILHGEIKEQRSQKIQNSSCFKNFVSKSIFLLFKWYFQKLPMESSKKQNKNRFQFGEADF